MLLDLNKISYENEAAAGRPRPVLPVVAAVNPEIAYFADKAEQVFIFCGYLVFKCIRTVEEIGHKMQLRKSKIVNKELVTAAFELVFALLVISAKAPADNVGISGRFHCPCFVVSISHLI